LNRLAIAHYVGQLFIILAAFLVAPLALSIYDHTTPATVAYGVSLVISLGLGFLLRYMGTKLPELRIMRRDAFGIVSFGWIGIGILAAIPFYLEGSIPRFSSCLFESISGLTTTGATVISDIEGLSRATHLWRVLLHWIGGMGIVVLFVAIFPHIGVGGKHLFKSEVAGPTSEGLKPRIKHTALRLWWLYVTLTGVCAVLLFLVGFPIFDAFCHALSTLSTGGFSTKASSVGAFDNPAAEWIIISFMFFGAANFGLYYGAFHGKFESLYRNIELRAFFFINAFVSLFIFFCTTGISGHNWIEEYRDILFQTLSVTTTTGLMTDDFDLYPVVGKFLLFLCMFIGGCAGSTAGGIKVSRVLILIKRSFQEMRLFLNPHEVFATKLGKQKIRPGIINSIFIFVALFIIIYLVGVFLMLLLGHGLLTAATSVIACLSSIGPGFGPVGPTQNYEFIHPLGKIILCFFMIAGRLEIFVLLSILTPSFWRRGL